MVILKKVTAKLMISLLILSSCASSPQNYKSSNSADLDKFSPKQSHSNRDLKADLLEFLSYQKLDSQEIKFLHDRVKKKEVGSDLRNLADEFIYNAQLLTTQKSYALNVNAQDIYSREIIEIAYKMALPIQLQWSKDSKIGLPDSLILGKLQGFCQSMQADVLDSLKNQLSLFPQSSLIIYSNRYRNAVSALRDSIPGVEVIKLDNSKDPQEFAAKILGINQSINRFQVITKLNPNQKLQFIPNPRSDISQLILLFESDDYKLFGPALRYHGGNNFNYVNFISSMDAIGDPKQLLDYEGVQLPISSLLLSKIKNGSAESLEKIVERSILQDWMLLQAIKKSKIRVAKIQGMTGLISYKRGSCAKREIPLHRVHSSWFST